MVSRSNSLSFCLASLLVLVPSCSLLFDGSAFRVDAGPGSDAPPACTLSSCDRGLVCDPRSGACVDRCMIGSCPMGQTCNVVTGLCLGSCAGGTGCRAAEFCMGSTCEPCDGDSDGWADGRAPSGTCDGPTLAGRGDCDDADPNRHPYRFPDCNPSTDEACDAAERSRATAVLAGAFEVGATVPLVLPVSGIRSLHVEPLEASATDALVVAAFHFDNAGARDAGVVRGRFSAAGAPAGVSPESLPGWSDPSVGASHLSAVPRAGDLFVFTADFFGTATPSLRRYGAVVGGTRIVAAAGASYAYAYPAAMLTGVPGAAAFNDPAAPGGGVMGIRAVFERAMAPYVVSIDGASDDAGPAAPLTNPVGRGIGGEGYYAFEFGRGLLIGTGDPDDIPFQIDLTMGPPQGRIGFGSIAEMGPRGMLGAAFAAPTTLETAWNCAAGSCASRPRFIPPVMPATDHLLTLDAIDRDRYLIAYVGEAAGRSVLVLFIVEPAGSGRILGMQVVPIPVLTATDLDIGVRDDGSAITVAFGIAGSGSLVAGALRVCE